MTFRFESGKTLKDVAEEYGRSVERVRALQKLGCSEAEIHRVFTHRSLLSLCRERNVSYTMVQTRVSKGMSAEEALRLPPKHTGQRTSGPNTKYFYKGTPLNRVVSQIPYNRIVRQFKAGKGTIEELAEKELHQ